MISLIGNFIASVFSLFHVIFLFEFSLLSVFWYKHTGNTLIVFIRSLKYVSLYLFCTKVFNIFRVIFIQEPILNLSDLKEIHSEMKLLVAGPMVFINSHDGVDMVRLHFMLT